MYRDSSWSEGNWFTCFTIHLLTFTWPLRNEAIRQETLRLSWLSMSAPADTSSWTTSRCPPVTAQKIMKHIIFFIFPEDWDLPILLHLLHFNTSYINNLPLQASQRGEFPFLFFTSTAAFLKVLEFIIKIAMSEMGEYLILVLMIFEEEQCS